MAQSHPNASPSMPMAYCLRDLPLDAQLLIDDFRRHWLDLAYLRASGGTPSARAMKSVRWQNRRFHPSRRYNGRPEFYYDSSGIWRLQSDCPTNKLFSIHDDDAYHGLLSYGRALRVSRFHLWAPPTDNYEDDDHISYGWLTDDDEPSHFDRDAW